MSGIQAARSFLRNPMRLSVLIVIAALGVAIAFGASPTPWPGASASGDWAEAARSRFAGMLALAALIGAGAVVIATPRLRSDLRTSSGPHAGALGRTEAWAIVAALTALGLLLRLPGLKLGLWRDEAASYFNALPEATDGVLEAVRIFELNPPGYYLALHAWIESFGGGEVSIKVPSMILGTLLIPICYATACVVGSRFAGVLASGLLALSPPAIYLSQEARPYALAGALCGLALAVYLKALVSPRRTPLLVLFTLLGAAALYTHYTGLILFAGLGGATGLVFLLRRDIPGLVPFALSFLAILTLFLPWSGVFIEHVATGTPWTEKESLFERPLTFLKNIAYVLPWERSQWIDGPLTLGVVGGAAMLFWRAGRQALSGSRRMGREEALAVAAAAYLGTAFVLAAMSYTNRYMFLVLPAACVLLGVWLSLGVERLPRRMAGAALPAAMLALFGWISVHGWKQATIDRIPKSGVRSFAAAYGPEHDPDTFYIVAPDFLGPTFAYYFREREIALAGLGRIENPHLFTPRGYAEIWSRDGLLEETAAKVEAAAASGFGKLALIERDCGDPLVDRRALRYSLSHAFADRMEVTYPMISTTTYPGEWECVEAHLFDIKIESRRDEAAMADAATD